MSKEPVRRQWADDDEDDDREVKSFLIPISTLLLHTISGDLLIFLTKNLKHRNKVTERLERYRERQNHILSKCQKSEGNTYIFIIELLLSCLEKSSSAVFLFQTGQDHDEISHSRSENSGAEESSYEEKFT